MTKFDTGFEPGPSDLHFNVLFTGLKTGFVL